MFKYISRVARAVGLWKLREWVIQDCSKGKAEKLTFITCRDSSSSLLVGLQSALAAVSYLSKMHFGDTFKSVERRAAFAHADCRGGKQEGKGTLILGQQSALIRS